MTDEGSHHTQDDQHDEPKLIPGPSGGVGVLLAVMEVKKSLLGGVGRTGTNDFHHFDFRKADAVNDALAQPMVDAQLLLLPWADSGERFHFVTNSGGQDSLLMHAVTFRLFYAEDGSSLIFRMSSQGQGNTPYSSGSAMSYAYKYAMSVLFNIPYGDERFDLDSGPADFERNRVASPPMDDWQRAGWDGRDSHDAFYAQVFNHLKDLKAAVSTSEGTDREVADAELQAAKSYLMGVQAMNADGYLKLIPAAVSSDIRNRLLRDEAFEPEPTNGGGLRDLWKQVATELDYQPGATLLLPEIVAALRSADPDRTIEEVDVMAVLSMEVRAGIMEQLDLSPDRAGWMVRGEKAEPPDQTEEIQRQSDARQARHDAAQEAKDDEPEPQPEPDGE